jgi:hypothetical protein
MSLDINQVRALSIGCKAIKDQLPTNSVFEYHIESAIYQLDKCCAIWDEVSPGDYDQLEFDLVQNN